MGELLVARRLRWDPDERNEVREANSALRFGETPRCVLNSTMAIQELSTVRRQANEHFPTLLASEFEEGTFGGLLPNRESGT
jgi:hypothetical protein